jgi:hypothetical protein|tara:strand:- start:341 stop:787 length:447 start_codon:yes stop_codon:yes gene_type:complete
MGYFGDLYNNGLSELNEYLGGVQSREKLKTVVNTLPIDKISNDIEISNIRDLSSSVDPSIPPEFSEITHYDNEEHLVESSELDLFQQKSYTPQKDKKNPNIRYSKGSDSNTETELLSLAKGINDYKKQLKDESEIYNPDNNRKMSVWH